MNGKRVLLLGATGYVGSEFDLVLQQRGFEVSKPRHRVVDYSSFTTLVGLLRELKPAFVVNCAGYVGKPNVDACEAAKSETLLGNAVLPVTIAHACEATGTAWGHVSSGCIFSGAKLRSGAGVSVETDLTSTSARTAIAGGAEVIGFDESDAPNFSFRSPPCSFYSGSKALAEDALRDAPRAYVWRLRIPFDERDNPRNYLSKLLTYPKVYDNTNSLSHRRDFVNACLELWQSEAPYGTYNLTNPGYVTTRQVVDVIKRQLAPARNFEFWESDQAFYSGGAVAPRSNCVLDTSKAAAAGVRMPAVEAALETAIRNWAPRTASG